MEVGGGVASEVTSQTRSLPPICSIFFSHFTFLVGAEGCIFMLGFYGDRFSPAAPSTPLISRLADQWFPKRGLWTSSTSVPWKLVRHANSWASPQARVGPVIRI